MLARSVMSVMKTSTLITWSGRPPAWRRQVSIDFSAISNWLTVSGGMVPSAFMPTMPER